ncbi:MAG TPA: glycosyl transferase family 2 [Firmicutes bacterium]|nr:glycosyl transferase family 2 [Bacillota bacterium]
MKVLLIIPAFNEDKNIERVIENLKLHLPTCDYVVINDCSRDTTASVCKEHQYNLIDLPINLGLAGAVQVGYKYAYDHGYDVAIQYDGDGQHKAEFIPLMVKEIEKGSDIVIGSRFVTKKKPWNFRMIGSRFIVMSIRFTTGVRITDPTSGMRAINRKLIKEFAFNMNYPPEPDTIAYQLRKGAIIKEIQVEMDERIEGESYLGVVNSIKYMLRMLTSILLIQGLRK